MPKTQAAILDCGAGRVTLGTFARRGLQLSVEGFAVESLRADRPEGGMLGSAAWFERLGSALRLLRERLTRAGPVTVIVPTAFLLTKHVRAPRGSRRQTEAAIRFELARAWPLPLEELEWTHLLAREHEDGKEMLVVAAKRDSLLRLCRAVDEAGFDLRRLLPAPLAVLAAVRWATPGHNAARLVVHTDGSATAMILEDAAGFSVRTVPAGRNELMPRMGVEIRRTVAHFAGLHRTEAPSRIVLASIGLEKEAMEQCAAAAGLSVEAIDWRSRLAGAVTSLPEVDDGGPAGPIGAAVLATAAGESPLAADLSPPSVRRRASSRHRRPWLALAAALILGALVPPLVRLQGIEERTNRAAEEIEREMAPWQMREARITRELAHLNELRRRVGAFDDIVARRHRWLRLLADLDARLHRIDGAWLERMRVVSADEGSVRIEIAGAVRARAAERDEVAVGRLKDLLRELDASAQVTALENQRFAHAPDAVKFELLLVTNRGGAL